MIAVDTNVLVRLATGDTAAEYLAARAALAGQRVFVAKTVILETDWVLRSFYAFNAQEIIAFWDSITANEQFAVEDEAQLREALKAARGGLDFADALHLAAAKGLDFYTFDKPLSRRAKRPVVLLKS